MGLSLRPPILTCPSQYHLGVDCDEAVAFRECGVTRVGGSVRGGRGLVGSHEALNLRRIDGAWGFVNIPTFLFSSYLPDNKSPA